MTVWYLPTPADAQAMWGQVRLHAAGSARSGKTSGPVGGVGEAAVFSGTPTTLGQVGDLDLYALSSNIIVTVHLSHDQDGRQVPIPGWATLRTAAAGVTTRLLAHLT